MQELATTLRDPMVRTILTLVAICLTVGLFLAARRRKRLSYSLSDTRVLGVHESVNPSRVQILFDGVPVTDVRVLIITVNNWGNEPIRVDDFERPLRFSWPEPARILTAEVVEVSPESLQPTIHAGVNEIVVDPLLLNPGDRFQIKTLINKVSNLSVDARVVGVKRITKAVTGDKFRPVRRLLLVALVGLVGATVTFVGEVLGLWVANGRAEVLLTRVVLLGMLFLLADELKILTLELISRLKKKDDSK